MYVYLKFQYRNWRGEEHTYVIEPTGADVSPPSFDHEPNRVMLHGNLISRDGDERCDLGISRQRSFVLVNMRLMEEVEQ